MTIQLPSDLRAVIFDLDGVVFDSMHQNVALYNHILKAVGLEPRAQQSLEIIHRCSIDESLAHLVGHGERLQRAKEYWRTLDPTPFINKLRLFPGVAQTLEKLSKSFALAVATNRDKTTEQALRHFDLLRYFQAIATPTHAGCVKPDAAMMHYVLSALGITAEQAVYVGDSPVDQQLSQGAGVALIAFQAPGLDAWAHVEHMQQIPPLLGIE